jgi:uncharacterized protein
MISKEKIKQQVKTILSLDSHPAHISAGFAAGVFIGFTPPIPGLHTGLALLVAFLFRLNKVTCIAGCWLNSPVTIIPSMVFAYMLGAWIMGYETVNLNIDSMDWESLKVILMDHSKPLLLGCSILGFVAAIIAYFACYWAVVFFRRKDVVLEEATREMEVTGEDIN